MTSPPLEARDASSGTSLIAPLAQRVRETIHAAVLSGLRIVLGDSYRKVVFAKIWAGNYWGDAESRSGTGSNLRETEHVRRGLRELFEQLRLRSVLDLPCGDFHWMREVPLPAGSGYLGGDIVEPLIRRNASQYGSETRRFQTMDLIHDPLPAADLILCRDGLVHFSFADIRATIFNFKLSGTEYLLTTHFSGNRKNDDIRTGQWRRLNLTQAPFHFPPPLLTIDEQCTEKNGEFRDKCLALWRLKDLPEKF